MKPGLFGNRSGVRRRKWASRVREQAPCRGFRDVGRMLEKGRKMMVGIALAALGLAFSLVMWRLRRGPSFGDRLAAFHGAGLIMGLGILLLAGSSGSGELTLFVSVLVPAILVIALSLHKLSVQGAPSGRLAPMSAGETFSGDGPDPGARADG